MENTSPKKLFSSFIGVKYFISVISKFLFDFFEELEEAAEAGKQISIDWCYRADDSSMQEAGEDFEEDFEDAQYQLVEIWTNPKREFPWSLRISTNC